MYASVMATYEWVLAHLWTRQRTYRIESCHIWICHVTQMNESCTTYEWVMPHMNESCTTFEWVKPHIWMTHAKRMEYLAPQIQIEILVSFELYCEIWVSRFCWIWGCRAFSAISNMHYLWSPMIYSSSWFTNDIFVCLHDSRMLFISLPESFAFIHLSHVHSEHKSDTVEC